MYQFVALDNVPSKLSILRAAIPSKQRVEGSSPSAPSITFRILRVLALLPHRKTSTQEFIAPAGNSFPTHAPRRYTAPVRTAPPNERNVEWATRPDSTLCFDQLLVNGTAINPWTRPLAVYWPTITPSGLMPYTMVADASGKSTVTGAEPSGSCRNPWRWPAPSR
jgi:hypothetical protein